MKKIAIIGGGLAGSEAAWCLAEAGHCVDLFEMRPMRTTEAHLSSDLGELVCSNSLKSLSEFSAPGILKKELQSMQSFILTAAEHAKIPGGQSLTVDRKVFSAYITQKLSQHPRIEIHRQEICELESLLANPIYTCILMATGPLTSESLAKSFQKYCGDSKKLYFYDAIAPILDADSIDKNIAFAADRYNKGTADYLNLPLNKEQYYQFVEDVKNAEKMPLHDFENVAYFESCLPIEVMIERGPETLRFGPMKPVGLMDPNTQKRPWAVIQLRMENQHGTMYSMVGFQTKMKWNEQKRIFQTIPGLKDAEFHRFGSIHRNSYIHSPSLLNKDLSLRSESRIFVAGQFTGVEGYTESTAIGHLAARAIQCRLEQKEFLGPSPDTVIGSLYHYITSPPKASFQPMNANFGLLPPLEESQLTEESKKFKKIPKDMRKELFCIRAQKSFLPFRNHFLS